MKKLNLNLLSDYKNSVMPFGILYAISLVLIHSIIVFILDNLNYRILCFININQDLVLNNLVILFNFINSIISIFILYYLSSDLKFLNHKKFKAYYKDYIYLFLIIFFFRIFYDNSIYPLTSKMFSNNNLIINSYGSLIFISNIIIAPIVEEFFYRGLILNGLSKKYNTPKSIIISSTIFALMHSNMIQDINAFVFSLIISYVFLYSGSLKLAIFIHISNNVIVTLFSSFFVFTNMLSIIIIIPLSLILVAYFFKKLNIKNRGKLCIKNLGNINSHL